MYLHDFMIIYKSNHFHTQSDNIYQICKIIKSLFFLTPPIQEYERAVIFRLGRLLRGGARGPGVFFTIPCVDTHVKIDLRTATYEIPPQEVEFYINLNYFFSFFICRF